MSVRLAVRHSRQVERLLVIAVEATLPLDPSETSEVQDLVLDAWDGLEHETQTQLRALIGDRWPRVVIATREEEFSGAHG